jgi:hypothetical protein
MDIIEIEKHKLIIKNSKNLISVVFDNDKSILTDIIIRSEKALEEVNNTELTIVDPTKTEIGRFSKVIKSIINTRFVKPLLRDDSSDYLYDFICNEHYIFDINSRESFYEAESLCCSCRKKIIDSDIETDRLYEEEWNMKNEFKKACNKLLLEKDLCLKHILLSRKFGVYPDANPLAKSIKDTIKNEIIKAFQEQNEELITKYI